jgi:hypothetical protein
MGRSVRYVVRANQTFELSGNVSLTGKAPSVPGSLAEKENALGGVQRG